jgi:hypothetical protein
MPFLSYDHGRMEAIANRMGEEDRKMIARGWLSLLCGSFVVLAAWGIGHADWRDVPDVKGVCSAGCESPSPPTSYRPPGRIYRDMPSERPIKEPVYGPSPTQVEEAEARARRAERVRQELKQQIKRVSSTGTVVTSVSSVVVRPGSSFFNIPSGVETTLTAPLAGVKTPGSMIPIENLQRAMAILSVAMRAQNGMTDEDASFLAIQGAFAMDGAPLQVAVAVPVAAGADEKERARQLALLTEGIQKDHQDLDAAVSARLDAEGELRQSKGNGDFTKYRKAVEREQKARDSIAEKATQLRFILEKVSKPQ